MAIFPAPFLCLWCRRFRPESETEGCTAFPDGIPDAVAQNRQDHREPIDGDNGLRFDPDDGYQDSVDFVDSLFA